MKTFIGNPLDAEYENEDELDEFERGVNLTVNDNLGVDEDIFGTNDDDEDPDPIYSDTEYSLPDNFGVDGDVFETIENDDDEDLDPIYSDTDYNLDNDGYDYDSNFEQLEFSSEDEDPDDVFDLGYTTFATTDACETLDKDPSYPVDSESELLDEESDL